MSRSKRPLCRTFGAPILCSANPGLTPGATIVPALRAWCGEHRMSLFPHWVAAFQRRRRDTLIAPAVRPGSEGFCSLSAEGAALLIPVILKACKSPGRALAAGHS